jgi:gamma-glutamyltranspeptidase/glutathione hydrolase
LNRRRPAAATTTISNAFRANNGFPCDGAAVSYSRMQRPGISRSAAMMLISTAAAAILAIVASASILAAGSSHSMVVAEGDLAAKAGMEILNRGGNAVDAAAAVSLALGVTNSGSCGIGGGGFMLIYWAKTGKLYALDYRERAPAAASANMYLRDGQPDEQLAREGPLAVAVPGEIAGLDSALRRFGTMRFSQVAAGFPHRIFHPKRRRPQSRRYRLHA